MQLDVISLDNQKVGTVDLDESIFGLDVRGDLLARYVNWQLAKRRAGTHKTKGRSEVSGSRAKPFRQKGTGRARQGSKQGPHMRGGATQFGPTPRDHGHDLPKKVRRLALKTALSAKQAEGKLVVLDKAEMDQPKTAELAKQLKALGFTSALFIDGDAVNESFKKASGNLIGFDVLPSVGANVYDILRRDTLVLTQAAVAQLSERLK